MIVQGIPSLGGQWIGTFAPTMLLQKNGHYSNLMICAMGCAWDGRVSGLPARR